MRKAGPLFSLRQDDLIADSRESSFLLLRFKLLYFDHIHRTDLCLELVAAHERA